MRPAAPLLFALTVGACAPSPPDLVVDLRTDWIAGPELAVEVAVRPNADGQRRALARWADHRAQPLRDGLGRADRSVRLPPERGVELEDVPFDAAGLPYGAGPRAAGAHAVP